MFLKIGALKKFANFTEKHQCWSLFLIKLQAKTSISYPLTRTGTCANQGAIIIILSLQLY